MLCAWGERMKDRGVELWISTAACLLAGEPQLPSPLAHEGHLSTALLPNLVRQNVMRSTVSHTGHGQRRRLEDRKQNSPV